MSVGWFCQFSLESPFWFFKPSCRHPSVVYPEVEPGHPSSLPPLVVRLIFFGLVSFVSALLGFGLCPLLFSCFFCCLSWLLRMYHGQIPWSASMSEHDFMVEIFKSLPKAVVRACQFLPKNYVRVTFKDEASCDAALIKGVAVGGFQLNVFEADPKATLLYCYWVPVEVSTESIRHALSAFGQVMDIQRQVHAAFPTVESGVRLVRIKLNSPVPEVVRILNFPCKVFYRGQPKSCRVCKKSGHLAKDCPLKDKCYRCGSAEHIARNCTNAWGTAPAAGDPPPAAPPRPADPATSQAAA